MLLSVSVIAAICAVMLSLVLLRTNKKRFLVLLDEEKDRNDQDKTDYYSKLRAKDEEIVQKESELSAKDKELNEIRLSLHDANNILSLSDVLGIDVISRYYFTGQEKKIISLINENMAQLKSDKGAYRDLVEQENLRLDDIVKKFRLDFKENVRNKDDWDKEEHLFVFLLSGMSATTIALLLNVNNTEIIYNRTARLKKKIKESESMRKEWYLRMIEMSQRKLKA